MAAADRPDRLVVEKLSQELSDELRESPQLTFDQTELDEDDAVLLSKREAAAQNRKSSLAESTHSLNQLKEQLAESRRQNGEHKKQIAQFKESLRTERDRVAESAAKLDGLQNQLESKVASVTRLERLNQHLIDQVKAKPSDDRGLSDELRDLQSKVERSTKERDDARAQIKTLEQIVATKASNLDSREADLRSKIEHAREEKVKVLQESVNHLEEERGQYEQNIGDLRSQVTVQTEKISDYTKQIGLWEARHEQAESERDHALAEIAKMKTDIQTLRRENRERARMSMGSDSGSRTSVASHMTNVAVEEALAQRDLAADKCRRLHQQLLQERQAAAVAGAGAGAADPQQVAQLKADRARLKRELTTMTRELQASMARSTETERKAQVMIELLTHELDNARGWRYQANESTDQAVHALGSRQAEVRAYKGATSELRNYVESLATRGDRTSVEELENVLLATDTAGYDQLPDGWEMMISPEGLEYYVDHSRRLTTWAHPSTYYDPENMGTSTMEPLAMHATRSTPASSTDPGAAYRAGSYDEVHSDQAAFESKVSRLRNKHAGQPTSRNGSRRTAVAH
eukprot:m.104595 g.104595  ORF g.104595 m.104595 type:complete len:577 (+) comp12612_c0_seq2:120-1850(+)